MMGDRIVDSPWFALFAIMWATLLPAAVICRTGGDGALLTSLQTSKTQDGSSLPGEREFGLLNRRAGHRTDIL